MKRDSRTTRRDFLRIGTAAVAGAALPTPAAGLTSFAQSEKQHPPRKLVHRPLGRTGLKLPIVSMGSTYAINLVRAALEGGMVYIHTSGDYSEGNHERLVGKAVHGRDRDSFVVATSADLPYEFSGRGPSDDVGTSVDPKLIGESLEGSLKRLQLDYVDIYYLGSAGRRGSVMHEPYWEAIERLKRDGKMRFAGISTHENEPAVIQAAKESKFWDVVLTAFNFRQKHREKVRAAIHDAADAGLGIVAMKTQAGVYWDRGRNRKINMTAALKWALQDEHVHTSIPAFSNFEEMEEDLAVAADPTMTSQERADLDLGDDLGYSGHYCQQCGQCLAQCPAGMDVPTLMRSYMYAFAHGQPRKARDTLRSWTARDIACGSCSDCTVECSFGFDVKSRALDIARLLDVPDEFLKG
jgi:predicted aldo/keto reductase-like oxidoreductase